MLNIDRANMIVNTKASEAKSVNVNQASKSVSTITAEQDTVTLSKQAIALMNGEQNNIAEAASTYVKPDTASSLLAKGETSAQITAGTPYIVPDSETSSTATTSVSAQSARAIRFDEIMQSILANRTGVDKDKLAEIDIMIEDIGKNTTLSPEQKEQQIEALNQIKEEVINAGLALQKVTQQTGYSSTSLDDLTD